MEQAITFDLGTLVIARKERCGRRVNVNTDQKRTKKYRPRYIWEKTDHVRLCQIPNRERPDDQSVKLMLGERARVTQVLEGRYPMLFVTVENDPTRSGWVLDKDVEPVVE